jgi:predicted nucleic acid-binding protein
MIDNLASPFVYVDTNPIAYALEGPERLASALKDLFAIFRSKPGIAVTSELTLAEVLPKKRIPDRLFFDLLIWSKIFDPRPVTREVLIGTAPCRRIAATKLPDGRLSIPKLPDSIHVVTAVQAGCQAFLSSDHRIKLPQTIRLVQASEAGIKGLMQEMA